MADAMEALIDAIAERVARRFEVLPNHESRIAALESAVQMHSNKFADEDRDIDYDKLAEAINLTDLANEFDASNIADAVDFDDKVTDAVNNLTFEVRVR